MRRVILHIGQHKTGSKALQSALYANRLHLAEKRFAYPVTTVSAKPLRPWQMNHHDLFDAVRTEVLGPNAGTGVRECLRRIFDACDPSMNTVILSAEDLFDMHTAHDPQFDPEFVAAGSRILARELAGFASSVGVMCYLRRQDHLLAAHYAQFIKGSSTHHPTFDDFHARFAARLDADAILRHWEAAFGAGAVTVVPYEPAKMPSGIVADFFGRALGLAPPPVMEPFPEDLEAFNVTPSRDHIEFMRCLNRRSSRGRRVLRRQHVLESAFRDRGGWPTGITAWLSPGERAELLQRYESGNRRIARSQGIQCELFEEPLPAVDDPWEPPQPPGLRRLIALDGMARTFASRGPGARAGVFGSVRRRWSRRVLWIISPHGSPADETVATQLYGGIAGRPDLESAIVPKLDCNALLVPPRRVALVVLVGEPAGGGSESTWLRGLRWAGVRVVQICDGAIHGPDGFHAVLGHSPAGDEPPVTLLDDLVSG